MVIFETPVFTEQIIDIMDDEDYAKFQTTLCRNPVAGTVITGTSGLRKIRCKLPGRGKRGGARMIYYWFNNRQQIYMLFAYPKNKQVDLTTQQKSILMKYVKEELDYET